MLDEKSKAAWPYQFGLTYSVTLAAGELTTSMQVANTGEGEGGKPLEFQVLWHTYLGVDVS